MSVPILLLAASLFCTAGNAQDLRRGVADAQLIIVAQHRHTETTESRLILHRLKVLKTFQGPELTEVIVLGSEASSDIPKPSSTETRLYCLRKKNVGNPGLESSYQMLGYRGSNPKVDLNDDDDPSLSLIKILVAAQDGISPRKTCDRLFDLAVKQATSPRGAAIKIEAVQTLRERPMIAGKLSAFQMSTLLSLAVAETEDIPLRICLASLCAERRMKGVIEALCISLDRVDDPRFTLALGRMAKLVHAETASEVLQNEILKAHSQSKKSKLLHALGATQTQSALQILLRYHKINGPGAAIEAALIAHGSKQAKEAIEVPGKQK